MNEDGLKIFEELSNSGKSFEFSFESEQDGSKLSHWLLIKGRYGSTKWKYGSF